MSSVQGLTDHRCCTAGSNKNQNHNAEKHLDTGSAIGCMAEMLSTLNIMWRNVHSIACAMSLTIRYESCGGDLCYVRFWIVAILSHCRSFPLTSYFVDCTSHPVEVYSFSGHCVGHEKFKGKGFPNKSLGLGYWMECLPFTFTLTFGTTVTAGLSAVRAWHALRPCKLLRNLFSIWGWMHLGILNSNRIGSREMLPGTLNVLHRNSPPWNVIWILCLLDRASSW